MSAEILRRAASELRATVKGAADPSLVSDPEFKLAVADLLDTCAKSYHPDFHSLRHDGAFAVARTYLGEDQ